MMLDSFFMKINITKDTDTMKKGSILQFSTDDPLDRYIENKEIIVNIRDLELFKNIKFT